MDTSRALFVRSGQEFEEWLGARGGGEREAVLAIYKRASGKQTVTFDQLLEIAFCHGWVDVQTKGIDAETDAIRFVPRRAKSNRSPTNRAIVRRQLAEGRMRPAGIAALPDDLRLSTPVLGPRKNLGATARERGRTRFRVE